MEIEQIKAALIDIGKTLDKHGVYLAMDLDEKGNGRGLVLKHSGGERLFYTPACMTGDLRNAKYWLGGHPDMQRIGRRA